MSLCVYLCEAMGTCECAGAQWSSEEGTGFSRAAVTGARTKLTSSGRTFTPVIKLILKDFASPIIPPICMCPSKLILSNKEIVFYDLIINEKFEKF